MKAASRHSIHHIVASLLLLPLVAGAHDGPPPREGGPCATQPMAMRSGGPMMAPPHLRSPKLSAAQEDKLFTLMHEQAPRHRAAEKAAGAAADDMRTLGESGRFDAAQAKKLAVAHGKAVADLALLHAEADAHMRAVLTPEQRRQLDQRPPRDERPANPAEGRH